MLKTYSGGCHCGAVRFEAEIDLQRGSFRCNCSICSRTRFWPVRAAPDSFRLTSGATDIVEYAFASGRSRHYFCRHCGVRSFGVGETMSGERVYEVSVTCLDGVSEVELSAVPITYVDGRNDDWRRAPEITAHL